MNNVFYMLRNEFETDESYTGSDIMAVVLKTIKVRCCFLVFLVVKYLCSDFDQLMRKSHSVMSIPSMKLYEDYWKLTQRTRKHQRSLFLLHPALPCVEGTGVIWDVARVLYVGMAIVLQFETSLVL